ncbi:MAG: hypothetical protein HY303_10905, partial [Candidatus Wallbacteria bacterium]|nr:hypothetical protein [Candidatus Wallbacteria bacterium]
RPGLEPGEAAGRFAITTPLKRLDLSPPWLRASHGFEAAGGSLRSLGTSKPAPATADQELEWADDELVADHPDAALEGIGRYLKAHEADVSRQSELAIALGMTARAYVRLGKPAALISVLSRLQRDFAATPEGRLASEALDFIAKKGVDAYLKREK